MVMPLANTEPPRGPCELWSVCPAVRGGVRLEVWGGGNTGPRAVRAVAGSFCRKERLWAGACHVYSSQLDEVTVTPFRTSAPRVVQALWNR